MAPGSSRWDDAASHEFSLGELAMTEAARQRNLLLTRRAPRSQLCLQVSAGV